MDNIDILDALLEIKESSQQTVENTENINNALIDIESHLSKLVEILTDIYEKN